ncbi:MAG: hypothetical protein VX252_17650 [Myxococcota bacterium]|nr:hypothetical protein [Myxococcota bacterium]
MLRVRGIDRFRFLFIGVVLSGATLAQPALGDLGALVARGELGNHRISVLAAPSPLRVGEIVLSVSLQSKAKSEGVPVREVDLTFSPPKGAHMGDGHSHHAVIHAQARLDESTHPGMLGARVKLHEAGTWRVQARLNPSGNEAVFAFDLEVGPPASPWIDYGLAFAFPLLGILIFVWHQRRTLAGTRKNPTSA